MIKTKWMTKENIRKKITATTKIITKGRDSIHQKEEKAGKEEERESEQITKTYKAEDGEDSRGRSRNRQKHGLITLFLS